jgi:hypothetical protein
VPWMYLIIRFTALQCVVVGACRNWQTLLICLVSSVLNTAVLLPYSCTV